MKTSQVLISFFCVLVIIVGTSGSGSGHTWRPQGRFGKRLSPGNDAGNSYINLFPVVEVRPGNRSSWTCQDDVNVAENTQMEFQTKLSNIGLVTLVSYYEVYEHVRHVGVKLCFEGGQWTCVYNIGTAQDTVIADFGFSNSYEIPVEAFFSAKDITQFKIKPRLCTLSGLQGYPVCDFSTLAATREIEDLGALIGI